MGHDDPTRRPPGIVRDPWRNFSSIVPKPEAQPRKPISEEEDGADIDVDTDTDTDTHQEKYATILLQGYGGITVDGVTEPTHAALRVLEFCVDHRREIEPYLVEYGVIVVKMERVKTPDIKFYIQRADGWLLAIPGATTRDDGCAQLIQAMLRIQVNPALKKKLVEYHIRPYKV